MGQITEQWLWLQNHKKRYNIEITPLDNITIDEDDQKKEAGWWFSSSMTFLQSTLRGVSTIEANELVTTLEVTGK